MPRSVRSCRRAPFRRGLVLIDPPFEAPSEWESLAAAVAEARARFPAAIVAAWYPLKGRAAARTLGDMLVAGGVRDLVAYEFWLRPPLDAARLNGCGVLVANNPFRPGAGGRAPARGTRRPPGRCPGSAAHLADRAAGGRVSARAETAAPDIAVIGAGAWGQALAIVAARAGRRVALWARRPLEVCDASGLSRRLPGIALPAEIEVTGESSPPARRRWWWCRCSISGRCWHRLPGHSPLVFCCKGIEAASTLLPIELAAALQPERPAAVLSGPNFAREIAAGLPAASVLAAHDLALATRLAAVVGTELLRIYPGGDPLGCELAGAAKNVIAIAAGIATGAGLGENARAALITRGLAEIARLVQAEGGRTETVYGLAGAGDLLLTCTTPASRNFRVGAAIGRGEGAIPRTDGIDDVAEGVATAPALVARAAAGGVELPVAAMVARILSGAIGVSEACKILLARPRQRE